MHICLPSHLPWIFWFYHDGCLYVRFIIATIVKRVFVTNTVLVFIIM